MNKEKFKVQCTIKINGLEKNRYPFEGTFMQCRLFIYSVAWYMFTNLRRAGNLQHFYGFTRDDETGMLFYSIRRCENYKEKIRLDYRIIKNN